MEFFETSKNNSLNKQTYVNLRWIALIGQFSTINFVKFVFDFEFDFLLCSLIILIGFFSNLYLFYIHKENNLSNKFFFFFLNIDIFQLSLLLYLTGGIINPFAIFLIIPCIFSSINLDIRTNAIIFLVTVTSIIFLTFFKKDLPSPISLHFHISDYYYFSVPIALLIALSFLNYFGLKFGIEAKIRKEALNKIELMMAKEHELLSLGGQAAAAAHSFGTPLSTIKIIAQDLLQQEFDNKIIKKDIELLISQINRCNEILKKLTLNPTVEDNFIDENKNIKDHILEITKSFEEISEKKFILDFDKIKNKFVFFQSAEIIYGLRNFIGNANKFATKKVFISAMSNDFITRVNIFDDGEGFSKDILKKIGEPYIKSIDLKNSKSGLGLGIFIGKTLLEKNFAKIIFENSDVTGGALIKIEWNNQDLLNL